MEKPPCSHCKRQGSTTSRQASSTDSSRCAQCVPDQPASRGVQSLLSPEQLRRIADQHMRFERELEAAEEEHRVLDAKVQRLRRQKRMWFDKMMRAVERGIDDLEELERVERDEAEQAKQASGAAATRASADEAGPV